MKTIDDFFKDEEKLKRRVRKLNNEYGHLHLMFSVSSRIRSNKKNVIINQ